MPRPPPTKINNLTSDVTLKTFQIYIEFVEILLIQIQPDYKYINFIN